MCGMIEACFYSQEYKIPENTVFAKLYPSAFTHLLWIIFGLWYIGKCCLYNILSIMQ